MAENNNEERKIDENLQEIMKKVKSSSNSILSESEAKELILKINREFDFEKILDDLNKKYPLGNDKYVIFTNSNEQLYYENGEFFLISTTDISKPKKKITRMEALELYNQYYITNILNPLLKQKEKNIEKIKSHEIVIDSETKVESVKSNEQDIENVEHSKIENQIKNEINEKNEQIKTSINSKEQLADRLEELKQKEKEIKEKREEKTR